MEALARLSIFGSKLLAPGVVHGTIAMAELSPAVVAQMASVTEAACQRAVAPVREAVTSMERRLHNL